MVKQTVDEQANEKVTPNLIATHNPDRHTRYSKQLYVNDLTFTLY